MAAFAQLTESFSNSLPVVVLFINSSNSCDNLRWNHFRTLFAFRSSKNKNWNIKLNAMVGFRLSSSGEWMLPKIACQIWNKSDNVIRFYWSKKVLFTGKVIFPLSVCDTSLYFLKTHHKNESRYIEDSAYLLQ